MPCICLQLVIAAKITLLITVKSVMQMANVPVRMASLGTSVVTVSNWCSVVMSALSALCVQGLSDGVVKLILILWQ